MPVTPIGALPQIRPIEPIALPGAAAAPADGFATVFHNAVDTVEQLRSDAGGAVEGIFSGEGGELHTAVLATQKAELALDLFLQVRNKVVQAYQEIMRMPI
jgi:flagellar hook-basal body complex protein FliE